MRPRTIAPAATACFSICSAISGQMSHLLTQTKAGTLKCRASSSVRIRSCSPDIEGSVTITTAEAPVTEAMTEQPIPGGPSIRTNSRCVLRPDAALPAGQSKPIFLSFQPRRPALREPWAPRGCPKSSRRRTAGLSSQSRPADRNERIRHTLRRQSDRRNMSHPFC